jgi:predicted TIM-barrel fold metal-dependent hydrolase
LKHPEALTQLDALELREGPKKKLLYENAMKVFPYDR